MKFKITFKDPDGVWDSLQDAKLDLNDLPPEVQSVFDKFIDCSEYVTVEFDTETKTARVCEA
jgi:hypothetical protein